MSKPLIQVVSAEIYTQPFGTVHTSMSLMAPGNILVPAVHPGADMTNLPILGAILSHGFLSSSFLPIRLAFPVIASVLLGLSVEVPDVIIMDSFVDFVSSYEGTILKEAMQLSHIYMERLEGKLIYRYSKSLWLSTYRPTPQNISMVWHDMSFSETFGGNLCTTFSGTCCSPWVLEPVFN